jgi:hypothetical protein
MLILGTLYFEGVTLFKAPAGKRKFVLFLGYLADTGIEEARCFERGNGPSFAGENFSLIICPPDTLEIFCWCFTLSILH